MKSLNLSIIGFNSRWPNFLPEQPVSPTLNELSLTLQNIPLTLKQDFC